MQIDVSIAVCMRIYTRIQSVCILVHENMHIYTYYDIHVHAYTRVYMHKIHMWIWGKRKKMTGCVYSFLVHSGCLYDSITHTQTHLYICTSTPHHTWVCFTFRLHMSVNWYIPPYTLHTEGVVSRYVKFSARFSCVLPAHVDDCAECNTLFVLCPWNGERK